MDLAGQRSNFNAGMRKDRAVDQLIGICSGIVADGEINPAEVAFLRVWLSEHQEACRVFPGDLISRRLELILADGVVTSEERQDLLELLQQIAGHDFLETGSAAPEGPAIPADENPTIIIPGKSFCFTGKFAYGTRAKCEDAVLSRGGLPENSVTRALDYLVLGVGVSPDWRHETYGRKIERAMELRGEGRALQIVAEADWVQVIA